MCKELRKILRLLQHSHFETETDFQQESLFTIDLKTSCVYGYGPYSIFSTYRGPKYGKMCHIS